MRWPRRVRAIATGLDFGVRLDEVRPLDDIVWGVDVPMMVGADTIVSIVGLLATIEPARRALRIQPAEALKEA